MKNTMMKTFGSLTAKIAAFLLAFGLGSTAWGAITGTGTSADPYLIANATDLATFRDNVNNGNSYSGKYVKLASDITLSGPWSPIGTANTPFSGTFDGDGHTISGLVLNGPVEGTQLGLFGVISGTANNNYATIDDVWANGAFYETKVAEANYTAVVKNLVLANVNVSNSSGESPTRCTGALVGQASNAYIANIKASGSVSGVKGVGGIVGSLDGSVAKCCTNSATIVASGYNVGGIAGCANYREPLVASAFINCANSGNVTTTAAGGYAGGIVGMAQSGSAKCDIITGCSNSGTIHSVGASSGVGGIAGQGIAVKVISDCSNSGTITSEANVKCVGGIAGTSTSKVYDSANYANITVSANYLCGIYTYDQGNGGVGGLINGCVNEGTLTNTSTDSGAQTHQLAANSKAAVFSNQVYADVAAVNAVIAASAGNNSIEFQNCTVTDKSGTLILNSGLNSVISDTQLCTAVDVSTGNASSLTVDIPGVDVTVAANRTGNLNVLGANNTVTMNSGVTVANLFVSGNGSSVTNNGTVTYLRLGGSGAVAAVNKGTLGKLGFDAGTYTVDNNGTISHTQSAANASANEHTVSTIKAATITINNYGTIESKKNANDVCSYALLFYGGSTVVINCYDGSLISCEKSSFLLACGSANSVTFNVQEGAFFQNGASTAAPTSYGNVIVNAMADPVAKIGDTEYESLAAAVAEATEGQTITLLADATDSLVTIPSTVTLNAGGFDYTAYIGAGTSADPYQISNLSTLKAFRDYVDLQLSDGTSQYAGKYFKLTSDIDLSGENWEPIGSMVGDHGSFKGVFDGDNHTIKNLSVQKAEKGLGFFSYTTGDAMIKNLTFTNVTVKSTAPTAHAKGSWVGGVVGDAFANTVISNVHVVGSIDIEGYGYVGGMVGHGYVKVYDSAVEGEGTIKGNMWCTGGIVGYAGEGTTDVRNSFVTGTGTGLTVQAAAGGCGAIVGMAEDDSGRSPISGSNLAATNVTVGTFVGGFGTSYATYCLGYLYGGNSDQYLSGGLTVNNVTFDAQGNANPPVQDAVATVDDTIYFVLSSAVDAAQSGDIVTVTRNLKLRESISIDSDVTIDLAGKTIALADGVESAFVISGDTTLTVNNGTAVVAIEGYDSNYRVMSETDGAATIYSAVPCAAEIAGTPYRTFAEAIAAADAVLAETDVDPVITVLDANAEQNNPDWRIVGDTLVRKVYVAQIGDQKFETLAEAIAAVPTDGTATTIQMITDATLAAAVGIPAEKNVILDLNGKTVSGAVNTAQNCALVENNGTLKIVDTLGGGRIVNTAPGTTSDKWHGVSNAGTLVIEGGAFSTASLGGYVVRTVTGGVTTVEGISVTGGTMKGVFQTAGGTLFVNDADIDVSCDYYVFDVRGDGGTPATGGSVTVNGGSFELTHTNGQQMLNFAMGEGGDNTLTINGGDFTFVNTTEATKELLVFNSIASASGTYAFKIAGGTFTGPSENWNLIWLHSQTVETFVAKGGSVVISGGNFYTNPQNETSEYNWPARGVTLADGYSYSGPLTDDDNKIYYIVVSDYDAQIVRGGAVVQKGTLAEMVAAAESGDTVQLLRDVEISSTVTLNLAGNVIIDGNGYTVMPSTGFAGVSAFLLGDTSATTIGNGNYTVANTTFSGFNTTHGVLRCQGSTVNIADCTFTGNGAGEKWGVVSGTHACLTVQGCTFTGNTCAMCIDFNFNGGGTNAGAGSLAVAGNLFSDNTISGSGVIFSNGSTGTADSITGNTFSGNAINASACAVLYISGTVEDISGNLFENNNITAEAGKKEAVIVLGSGSTGTAINDNAFVGNVLATGSEKRATVYTGANCDLSGNYWGDGAAPETGTGLDIRIDDGKTPVIAVTGHATAYATSSGVNGATVTVQKYFYQDAEDANLWHVVNLVGLKEFRDSVNGGNNYKNKTIQLDNPVDLAGENWTPIGINKDKPFKGTFDGRNNTVSNLCIDNAALDRAGLFGYGSTATFRNIAIHNASITAHNSVGSLIGETYDTPITIQNCSVTGSINLNANHYVGGLGGHLYGWPNISNCSVDGGDAATSIVRAASHVASDGDGDDAGGLVGFAEPATITGCSVKNVTVEGYRQAGGLAGLIAYGTVSGDSVNDVVVRCIADEYTAQNNTKKMAFGGLIGVIRSATENTLIEDCAISGVSLESTATGLSVARMGYITGGIYATDAFEVASSVPLTVEDVTVENCTRVAGTLLPVPSSTMPVDGYVSVAKIGNTGYTTLAAALKAAADGDVIEILAAEISEGSITFPATMKNVTIKAADGVTPTLKDMVLNSATGSAVDYEGITIDGLVFDNSRLLFTGRRTSVVYKDWAIVNCTFTNIVASGNYAAVQFGNFTADKESMNGFTFTNNVIDGVSGSSNSGLNVNSLSGDVLIEGNLITNVAWNALQLMNGVEGATLMITNNLLSSKATEGVINLFNNKAQIAIVENAIIGDGEGVANIAYPSTTIDASSNYWGGGEPTLSGAQTGGNLLWHSYYTTYTDTADWFTLSNPIVFVAQIGDVKYETLAAAIAAVPTDGTATTVTLLKDVSGETIAVNGGRNVVLDLGGHELTPSLLYVLNGTLEAKNGTIKNSVYVYGLNTDNSGMSSTFTLAQDATIASHYGVILYNYPNTSNAYDATVNINGTVHGNVWVMGNITEGDSVINVAGTVDATGQSDVGIALNGNATVNVVDGAVVTSKSASTGLGTGIEVRAGTLNVTGGTIAGQGSPAASAGNESGTTSTGVGIAVSTYEISDISVNISGGTVTGYAPLYFVNTKGTTNKELDVAVTGGTFTANNGGTSAIFVDESEAERVVGFVANGETTTPVFSSAVAEEYCDTGFIPKDNGDGTYGVKAGAYVAQIETSVTYTKLAANITEASDDVYLDIWTYWGMQGMKDADGKTCPRYVSITDNTMYRDLAVEEGQAEDWVSAKYIYDNYFAPGKSKNNKQTTYLYNGTAASVRKYETLPAALADVQANEKITLLANVAEGGVLPYAATLDKVGFTCGTLTAPEHYAVVNFSGNTDIYRTFMDNWERPDYADLSWYTANPSADSFEIASAAQFAGFAQLVNGKAFNADGTPCDAPIYGVYAFRNRTITLTADIDLTAHGWVPVGFDPFSQVNADYTSTYYRGTFDGGNHTITYALTEQNSIYDYDALFGGLYYTTIKNLKLNVAISYPGDIAAGYWSNDIYGGACALASYVANSVVISNVTMNGTATFGTYGTSGGGLVFAASGGAQFYDCVNNATVNIKQYYREGTGGYFIWGGIACQTTGTSSSPVPCAKFVRCVNNATVTMENPYDNDRLIGRSATGNGSMNILAELGKTTFYSRKLNAGGIVGQVSNNGYLVHAVDCENNGTIVGCHTEKFDANGQYKSLHQKGSFCGKEYVGGSSTPTDYTIVVSDASNKVFYTSDNTYWFLNVADVDLSACTLKGEGSYYRSSNKIYQKVGGAAVEVTDAETIELLNEGKRLVGPVVSSSRVVLQTTHGLYVAQIVTDNGATTNRYDALQAAINAVGDGETILILTNITETAYATAQYAYTEYTDKSFTIDFNGKTVTTAASPVPSRTVFNFVNKGSAARTVTLTHGTITAVSGTYNCVRSQGVEDEDSKGLSDANAPAAQTINIHGMTLNNNQGYGVAIKPYRNTTVDLAGTDINSDIGGNVDVQKDSKVVIHDGTFTQTSGDGATGDTDTCRVNVSVSYGGEAEILGGTFTSSKYCFEVCSSGGTIGISNATATAGGYVLRTTGGNGVIAVSDGKFAGSYASAAGDTISLSGGVYEQKPADSYAATGYAVAPNTDSATSAAYPWTVMEILTGDIIYPIEGTDGVPVALAWATNNTSVVSEGAPVTAANVPNIITALGENGANNMPRWESYVLGLDPKSATSQLRLAATAKNATTVTITGAIDTTKFPSISNMTVTFRLAARNDDGTWTDIATGAATPSFDVPLDVVAGKVLAIFADIVTE